MVDDSTDPQTARSYKSDESSTVYQTWFAATASLALSSLLISAVSVVEQKHVLRE